MRPNGFQQADDQVRRGGGRRAGVARRAGNPELTRDHLVVALLEQELPRTLLRRAGGIWTRFAQRPRRACARYPRSRAATLSPRRPRRSARRSTTLSTRRESSRTSSSWSSICCSRWTSCRAIAARRAQGRSRWAARDDAGSGGDVRGALEIWAGPHRCRRGGQARSGDRTRRGDPAHDPGALRRTKNNPVLIGEPGVGKTAIAEGLAIRIVAGDVPEGAEGQAVVALDVGALIAGASSGRV